MTTARLWLAQAIAYQEEKDGTANGAAQANLRRSIMARPGPAHGSAGDKMAREVLAYLKGVAVKDMPGTADDLSLLVDTICMREGFTTRAEAWRHIGINPNRGRDMLSRSSNAIDWPIWFTACHAAIGE